MNHIELQKTKAFAANEANVKPAADKPLNAQALHWIAAAVITALLPHFPRLPWWESLFILMVILIKLFLVQRHKFIPLWLLTPLTLSLAIGVWLSFGSFLGRSPGVALLAVMLGMKFLESRDYRDGMLLVFLAYFVIVTNFLFDQSVLVAGYLLIAMLVCTITLITMNQAENYPTPQKRFRLALRMLLEAIPIMLVLFIVFPRLPGPLWGLPEDHTSALSGLNDRMSPGQISQLINNGAVAFRVKFDKEPPPYQQRYWRGPVLTEFDGTTWRQQTPQVAQNYRVEVFGEVVDYVLTLEPHLKNWIFAMDLVVRPPARTRLSPEFQLLSEQPHTTVSQYRLSSYPLYRFRSPLTQEERDLAMQLPPASNPRSQAMGRRIAAEAQSPTQILARVLEYYREQGFRYTLNPPLLGEHAMDEFLFETRAGFCEHYAGSFVLLMRAAGIPARVVTGYLGGEINAVGDYLIVRQSDAHAWAEIWLEEGGWTRIDPTAAVAPERVQSGLESALTENQQLPLMVRRNAGWLKHVGLVWDSLNNGWNQWVLGYGPELQQGFFNHFGLRELTIVTTVLLLLIPIGLILLIVALLPHYFREGQRHHPLSRLYRRFCRKLAAGGLHKSAHEGALTFGERAATRWPQHATLIHNITKLYLQLRYSSHYDFQMQQQLRRSIATLKIKRRYSNE